MACEIFIYEIQCFRFEEEALRGDFDHDICRGFYFYAVSNIDSMPLKRHSAGKFSGFCSLGKQQKIFSLVTVWFAVELICRCQTAGIPVAKLEITVVQMFWGQ